MGVGRVITVVFGLVRDFMLVTEMDNRLLNDTKSLHELEYVLTFV